MSEGPLEKQWAWLTRTHTQTAVHWLTLTLVSCVIFLMTLPYLCVDSQVIE